MCKYDLVNPIHYISKHEMGKNLKRLVLPKVVGAAKWLPPVETWCK
jgi:hypothetical protein